MASLTAMEATVAQEHLAASPAARSLTQAAVEVRTAGQLQQSRIRAAQVEWEAVAQAAAMGWQAQMEPQTLAEAAAVGQEMA
jgi:hypothetical protein